MITITYKDAQGNWVEDSTTFTQLEKAKRHASKYPEYKAWRGETLLAHLFNKGADPVEHFHKVKAEETVTLEQLADEFDGIEEDAELDQEDDE